MVEKVPDSLKSTAPRLVLIVDDEDRMRRFIRMNLELEGYRVIFKNIPICFFEKPDQKNHQH